MKTDKLIEAFGEIDEDIFCEENVSSDKSEDEPTVITISGKKRKNPRPYLIGAAVMALAAAVPMIMLASKKNIEPERIPAATDNVSTTSVSTDAVPTETEADVTSEAAFDSSVYINGKKYTLTGEPRSSDRLVDFRLEEYYDPDKEGYQGMKDFLDSLDCSYKEELKDLYWRAFVTSFREGLSATDYIPCDWNRSELKDESGQRFCQTDFTYDSFINNYYEIFTEETVKKIFERNPFFLSYDEGLWMIGAAGWWNIATELPHEEYEILTQTDTELTIRRTLYYYDWINAGEEYEFDPDKKDLYAKSDSECKFVLTDDGWRIETFFDMLKSLYERDPSHPMNPANQGNEEASAVLSSDISEASARAAALAHAGIEEADAYFLKTRLDNDNGKAEYDIEFTANGSRYEYEIDALSGEVLEFSVEGLPSANNGTSSPSASLSAISEASARAAALAHAGIKEADAYFIKTKLDYDNGKAEYDIEFTAGGYRYEYEIDASSGAVLEYSSEKSPVQPADFISDEKARSIALEHCGVSPEQAFGVKTELDEEDGEFEVKFNANGFEYEVKLDARTGTVLEFERDD